MKEECIYLFSIDDTEYFLNKSNREIYLDDYNYENVNILKTSSS